MNNLTFPNSGGSNLGDAGNTSTGSSRNWWDRAIDSVKAAGGIIDVLKGDPDQVVIQQAPPTPPPSNDTGKYFMYGALILVGGVAAFFGFKYLSNL